MIPLFLGLTLANLAALLATAVLGLAASHSLAMARWHVACGALATLLCIAVHSVVFTYFIATGKWVQHAVAVMGLGDALATPTRSFRAQAFPAALGAIATVVLAAALGAATDNGLVPPMIHRAAALIALIVNGLTVPAEYRAIVRNGSLIRRILNNPGNESQ